MKALPSLLLRFLFVLCLCISVSKVQSNDGAFESISAPVRFYGMFNGTNVGTVSLRGVNSSETNIISDYICGEGAWFWTETATAMLDIYKTYTLTVSADYASRMEAHLFEPNIHDLLASRDKNLQRYNRYRLWIRKVETGVTNEWQLLCLSTAPTWDKDGDNDGDCHAVSIAYEVQLRPDLGARPIQIPGATVRDSEVNDDGWDQVESAIAAASAPGDESVLKLTGGKGNSSSKIDIEWGVNLGRLWNGRSAGKIRIVEDGISSATLKPSILLHTPRSLDTNEVEMLLGGSPLGIRQIKAPQTFVDVATLSTNSFQINFYYRDLMGSKDGSGYYTLATNATNFVSYLIDSGGATANRLAIHEIRNGKTNSSVLDYSSTSNLWTLTRGSGSDTRILTRHVSFQSNLVDRIEIEEVKDRDGTITERTGEVWKVQGLTRELVCITNGLGSANLVTISNYTTISNVNYLTYIEAPDGYWEKRVYSTLTNNNWYPYGSLIRIVRPWKNTASTNADNDCHVTVFSYSPGSPEAPLGQGTYSMQSWHNPLYYETEFIDPESLALDKDRAATYEEEVKYSADDCGTQNGIVTEFRHIGDLEHYGREEWTANYGGFSGRLSGQLYSTKATQEPLNSYDYQFGKWIPTNQIFSISGSTTDVRQVMYRGTAPGTGSGDMTIGDSGFAIEPIAIEPYKSTKHVKIISDGNLVATELHVMTGATTNGLLIERIVYQRDALGHVTNAVRYDPHSPGGRVFYQADWQGTNAGPGDRKLSETDESGVKTLFAYDSLKRVKTETKTGSSVSGYPAQAAIVSTFSYDASGRVLTNLTTAGSLSAQTRIQYDLAGRPTSHTGPDLLTTAYTYAHGGRQTNITYSSGTTTELKNYLDRRIASIAGTAAPNQHFNYYLTNIFAWGLMYPKNVTLVTKGGTNSSRWKTSITDHRHALWWEEEPGFRSEYAKQKEFNRNGLGVEVLETADSGVIEGQRDIRTHFTRDLFGILQQETTYGETPGWTALASADRIKTYDWYYELDNSNHLFRVNETWTYPNDNSDWKTLVSRTKERITGLTTNTISEILIYDSNTNQTTIKVTVDRLNKKVTRTTTVPESNLSGVEVSVNGLPQTETTTTVSVPAWHYYDALGREIAQKDSLGFSSGTLYNALGQVAAVTNKSGQITTFTYYPAGGTNAGLLYCESGPTGKKKYYNYNGFGQVTHIWGDVPYPEKRDYNSFGDLVTLTTYRGGSGWNNTNWASITTDTGDVTTWFYDEPTGLLTNKTDAAGRSVNYDYYFSHIPKSTINARGQGNLRLYSINGDLLEIRYTNSWGISSNLYSNYNRLGLPRSIVDDVGELNITYDHSGRVVQEAYTNGILSGVVVGNRYDLSRGKDRVQLQTPSGTVATDYAFDTRGRISGLTNGNASVSYAYVPNSDLLQTTTSRSNATTVLTTTRSWENGYRLRSIRNVAGASVVSSHDYVYDALDRRRIALREDLSTWQYDYNNRDELTRGGRFWSDSYPVAGQQFEYNYDNIGNRVQTAEGGNSSGGDLRFESYGGNNLNQITVRTNSDRTDITGAAFAKATVTVNGTMADRHGEYFHRSLPGGNVSTPAWQSITNIASANGISETNKGNLLLPPREQYFTYDYDGNLTSDGSWSYTWDAQNRLASMASLLSAPSPNEARKKLEFSYDYLGRRVAKHVSTWDGSEFSGTKTNKFIYNGWLLQGELNATNLLIRSYSWGIDLSRTLDVAGGVGGLCLLTDHTNSISYFPTYDANGSVVGLTALNGATVAHSEYSPFGQRIRSTGFGDLPIGWSTKYQDAETGLLYFGLRYYDPSTARWISRDQIEETDGNNVYSFVHNSPISNFDALGSFTLSDTAAGSTASAGSWYGAALSTLRTGASIYWRVQSFVSFHNAAQTAIAAAADGLDADELAELMQEAAQMVAERIAGKVAGVLAQKYRKWKHGEGHYKDVKGHHIHQKAAMDGAVGYDPKTGFSISQAYMKKRGWDHDTMTARQRLEQTALAKSGRPNTMEEQTRIAYEALVAGGAAPSDAKQLVVLSLAELMQQGVPGPTRIPWH